MVDIAPNPLDLNTLVFRAYQNARNHGFYDYCPDIKKPLVTAAEKLALLHFLSHKLNLVTTEVAEAGEELKSGRFFVGTVLIDPATSKIEGFAIELADIVIRVADLAGYVGVDLERAVRMKMEYNAGRPALHGGVL